MRKMAQEDLKKTTKQFSSDWSKTLRTTQKPEF